MLNLVEIKIGDLVVGMRDGNWRFVLRSARIEYPVFRITMSATDLENTALRNVRHFTLFRMFFSARFYYPVYALLFLDYGLTLPQFAMLNGLWALTIVVLEIPSGALADTVGRRNLLILAGVCMVVEMGVLLVAPIGGGTLLFVLFAINRVLSGAAEAAASGADEALVYDSMKEIGRAHV